MRLQHVVWCAVVAGLSGCSSTPYQKTQNISASEAQVAGAPPQEITTRLPKADTSKNMTLGQRIVPHGFTVGAWIDRSEGSTFQPLPPQGNNVAVVYLYRPDSKWNAQEIIAPSFFLNGRRLPGLKNNGYYWMEMPPGVHRLSIRRPIGFVYFQKGYTFDFKVEGGRNYYLRYDEQGFRGKVDPALGLSSEGPIEQLPEADALKEISATTLNTPGYSYVPLPDPVRTADIPSFTGMSARTVPSKRLQEKQKVVLGVPLKLWNPLTW